MKGTDLIRVSLEMSTGWLMVLIEGIKDAPLTFPTPQGGNHPLWILGHVVGSEAHMVHRFILGEESPLSSWDPIFGMNSTATADASQYPAMEELLAAAQQVRAKTLEVLDGMSEADLDRPSHAPAEVASMFGTVGQVFLAIGQHATFHAGQVADARRAAGREPVFG